MDTEVHPYTGGRTPRFAMDIQGALSDFSLQTTGLADFDLPDPIAMAVAIEPEIAEVEEVHVRVVTGDGPERGRTIFDWPGAIGQEPNVRAVRHASRERFLAMLHAALRDSRRTSA